MNRRSFVKLCASFVIGCALAIGSLKNEQEENQNKPSVDYENAEYKLTLIEIGGKKYHLDPYPLRFTMIGGKFVRVNSAKQ